MKQYLIEVPDSVYLSSPKNSDIKITEAKYVDSAEAGWNMAMNLMKDEGFTGKTYEEAVNYLTKPKFEQGTYVKWSDKSNKHVDFGVVIDDNDDGDDYHGILFADGTYDYICEDELEVMPHKGSAFSALMADLKKMCED